MTRVGDCAAFHFDKIPVILWDIGRFLEMFWIILSEKFEAF